MSDRWLPFFDPSRSLLLYLLGTLFLSITTALIYDALKEQYGWLGLIVVVSGLSALIVLAFVSPFLRRHVLGRVRVKDTQRPAPAQGLIVLVSPTPNRGRGTARPVIDYHLPSLKVCWLIATAGSISEADALVNEYEAKVSHRRVQFCWGKNYLVDGESVDDSLQVVQRILEEEAPRFGITHDHIIADITGGQKPMTVGMALACLERNQTMEYLRARRNAQGDADRDLQPEPIKLEVQSLRSLGG